MREPASERSNAVSEPAAVVVLAGGSGSRVGADRNKVLLPLAGLPILAHSVRTALTLDGVHRIVVVVRPDERELVAEELAPHLGTHDVWLVHGGAERHDSEYAALRALRSDIEAGEIGVVAIHDAARPLASAALFRETIDRAASDEAAVPAVTPSPLSDPDGHPACPSGELAAVQTPQAFAARPLLSAYDRAAEDGFRGTDTAACVEHYAVAVGAEIAIRRVAGERTNLKVTFPEDLALAEELLAR